MALDTNEERRVKEAIGHLDVAADELRHVRGVEANGVLVVAENLIRRLEDLLDADES